MLILSFICLKGFNLCTPGLYRRYIAISLNLYKSFRSSFSFLIFSSSGLLRQRRGTGDFVIGKTKEISFFLGYDISSIYKGFLGFQRNRKTEPHQFLVGFLNSRQCLLTLRLCGSRLGLFLGLGSHLMKVLRRGFLRFLRAGPIEQTT